MAAVKKTFTALAATRIGTKDRGTSQSQKVLQAAARCSHLHRALALWRRYLHSIKTFVWDCIEELLEEFQPWLKWLIFDALLTLVIGKLVTRFEGLRPFLEAVGWA